MSRRLWKSLPQREPASLLWGSQKRGKVTVSRSTGQNVDGPLDHRLIRNVGVMAHIDAGKTTTTERFLFYSGKINSPGEVHHGDTVTDFMPQERERGITIQSAVVSFPWKNHIVNLIDTPGHVDFTFEVQRSLRVVDAAIAILDASAGVEAQTLTVWRQATDYDLPKIIYLNKMDKNSASVDMCMESISSKLKCAPLLLQLPNYDKQGEKGSGLCGILDLVAMKRLIFDKDSKGSKVITVDVSQDKDIGRKHNELVEQLADFDSQLANKIIENESVELVTSNEIHAAMRRATMSNLAVPVLVGSSYKNIGVQPLMDSILRYFPEPSEGVAGNKIVKAYGSELCLFAFKTMHDQQLGTLTFLRVFSGSFQHGIKIYNVSRMKHEKISKIYLPLADELVETNEANEGQVVIVSGLKETVTGDTLTSSHSISTSVVKKLQKSGDKSQDEAVLNRVIVPEPVFFCSIEPISISHFKALEFALECLQREDPSLQVHVDPDTNQTILSGMGELHLDIIHARLKTEFKVEADLGKIQVAYKETIVNPVSKRTHFERRLADHNHSVSIEFELNSAPGSKGQSKVQLYHGRNKEKGENVSHITDRQLKHIQNGVDSAMRFGPKLSFPMTNIEVILHWFEISKWTSETIMEAAAAACFRECVQKSHVYLLEPVVSLEVTVDERYQRNVLDDLHRRRFVLKEVNHKHGNKQIIGNAPLSELMGYSTILRTISSGLGTFSMSFSQYELVNNPSEEQKIMQTVRGF